MKTDIKLCASSLMW